MGGAGRAPSAHHTLEPTQAGRWQASTQGGRDKSLSEHGRWLVCWLPGKWHFSGTKSQDGGGKLLSLQAGEGAWVMGGLPAILGDWFHPWRGLRQGCLGGPTAGMVSAVTRTGLAPGRHVFHRGLPRTSPCRRTAAGRGRPGALQGRAAGRPPCGGCACWGPSQWAVWTGVRGGPTSGSSAREREEPAGPLPVVGEARGFQQRPEGLTTATEKAEGQGRGQARVGCGGHRRSCDCFPVWVAREGRPPLRAGLGGLTEAPAGRRTG